MGHCSIFTIFPLGWSCEHFLHCVCTAKVCLIEPVCKPPPLWTPASLLRRIGSPNFSPVPTLGLRYDGVGRIVPVAGYCRIGVGRIVPDWGGLGSDQNILLILIDFCLKKGDFHALKRHFWGAKKPSKQHKPSSHMDGNALEGGFEPRKWRFKPEKGRFFWIFYQFYKHLTWSDPTDSYRPCRSSWSMRLSVRCSEVGSSNMKGLQNFSE